MTFLLDTCVLSEMRHPKGNGRVKQTIAALDDADLRLSVLTIGEIVKGIGGLAQGKRRKGLEKWLAQLETFHGARILPIDRETAHLWGELTAEARSRGEAVPVIDGLIAATAMQHGFTVVTRNTKHFMELGVPVFNPWESDD